MKALLVTSRIHFVPDNYDSFIRGLAECEYIGGLLVIDNLDLSLLKTACGITLIGARQIGIQIFKNIFSCSHRKRVQAFQSNRKPVWTVKTINSAQCKQIINEGKFDLVINARTRAIFSPEILRAPSRGCINIHHGILPEQRGVLCDLWALSEGCPAGFTIHYMTEKVDAGPIISCTQVSDGKDRDFLAYLKKSARVERVELEKVLQQLASGLEMQLLSNEKSPGMVYRKNPNANEIRRMKAEGMQV